MRHEHFYRVIVPGLPSMTKELQIEVISSITTEEEA
jgi:hypothetical protein